MKLNSINLPIRLSKLINMNTELTLKNIEKLNVEGKIKHFSHFDSSTSSSPANLDHLVFPDDVVTLDGEKIVDHQSNRKYIAFNKPSKKKKE